MSQKVKIMEGIKPLLMKMFNVLFFLTFLYIIMNVLFYPTVYGGPYNPIVILGGAILFVLFLFIIYSKLQMCDERLLKWITGINFIILMIFQMFFLLYFQVDPSWDFGAIYWDAVNIVENGGEFTLSSYFYFQYPNNIAILYLYVGIMKILNALHITKYLPFLILFNMMVVNLSVFLCYYLIRLRFGKRGGTLFSILMLFITPFYTYTTIVYTDTLAMIFPISSLLLYYLYCISENRRKKYMYILFMGVVLAIGTAIKTNVIITIVAILIHLIMTKKGKEIFLSGVLLAGSFYLPYSMMQSKMATYSPIPREEMGFPATHWVLMGMTDTYAHPGGYSHDTVLDTLRLKEQGLSNTELSAYHVEKMKETLNHYGVKGYVNFLRKKINYTWGDGTYYAFEKLSRFPVKESQFQPYIIGDQKHFLFNICQMIQVALLFLILVTSINLLKTTAKFEQALTILLFGVFLFLIFWEARSRYLVLYLPVIAILAINGIYSLQHFKKGKQLC